MAKGTTQVSTTTEESKSTPETKAASEESSKRVKYTGSTLHTRTLSAKDFETAGISDAGKVVWGPENNHVVDLSDNDSADQMIEWLTTSESLKGEFKVLKPGQS